MIENNVFPYFLLSFLLLLCSLLIVNNVKFFKTAVEKSRQAQYTTLDGLRGFLAISVFFHHVACTYNVFHSNTWSTSSNFYTFLGQGAVSFFFMITGFLFWTKAIKGKPFKIFEFYRARAFRIYPLYWLSLILIVLVTLTISNFRIDFDLKQTPILLLQWVFCIFAKPTSVPYINGIDPEIINAKVYWTLVYEIIFYLIFPLLLRLSRLSSFILLVLAIVPIGIATRNYHLLVASNFLFGMVTAYLLDRFELGKIFSSRWFSGIAIALLLININVAAGSYLTNFVSISLTFVVFLILVSGNSLFGLLTITASRYLGVISYSVYLLHGIVLFVVFHAINEMYPVQLLNPILFWLVAALCGLIVIVLSGFTYAYIESPFIYIKK